MAYKGGKYTIKNYREEIGRYSLPASYKKACVWNNKMQRLLAKDPGPTSKRFDFRPNGEVL